MAKKQIARWTAEETLRFLEIFRGYEAYGMRHMKLT